VSDRLEETRAAWDAEAAAFDEEPDHGLGDAATREAWWDLLLAHLPPAPARIADLGCGTGSLSVLLAEAGYDLTGLDLSPQMLAAARTKADRAGVPLRLVPGDAAEPDLEPGAYDAVLCRHVLWALPAPSAALARWVDLLRRGGRLVLVEGSWHTGAGLSARRTEELVREHRAQVEVLHLTDPVLWGGATGDERYLVVSTR